MPLLATFKRTLFRITIPIKGCSSFIYCKAWRHESEPVKIIYLDATESLICSRALMIAQISAVNRAISWKLLCLMERLVQATEIPSRDPSI